jgi:hypothetical protein
VKKHLEEFKESQQMIETKLFSNEDTELKNYGAIYKEGETYKLLNQKDQSKQVVAEVYLNNTLMQNG